MIIDELYLMVSLILLPVVMLTLLIAINAIIRCYRKAMIFTCVAVYYYVVFVLNQFFGFFPFSPDSLTFNLMLVSNSLPETYSQGVLQYHAFVQPIMLIANYKLELFMLALICISIFSYVLIWESFDILNQKNLASGKSYIFEAYIFLICVFPASLLYLTIPLREWLTLFGFSLIYYSVALIKVKKHGGVLILILSTILISIPRPTMIIIPLIAILVFFGNLRFKIYILAIAILLIPVVIEALTNLTFSPEFFSYLRNSANENYGESGMAYGIVEWRSYFDIFKDLPLLVLQFLLSPFPILHNNNPLTMAAHFFDAIFVSFVLLICFINSKKHRPIIGFVIITSALFSIWEFYLGGAVRHRFPLIALLLPLAAYSISKALIYLFRVTIKPNYNK